MSSGRIGTDIRFFLSLVREWPSRREVSRRDVASATFGLSHADYLSQPPQGQLRLSGRFRMPDTSTEERSAEWHGKAPDSFRYECKTCLVKMSTNDPTVELAQMWRDIHAGHELVEARDVEHTEPCTGIAATWCPNCGDCSCPVEIDDDGQVEVQFDDLHADARCPLHGLVSTHAGNPCA